MRLSLWALLGVSMEAGCERAPKKPSIETEVGGIILALEDEGVFCALSSLSGGIDLLAETRLALVAMLGMPSICWGGSLSLSLSLGRPTAPGMSTMALTKTAKSIG